MSNRAYWQWKRAARVKKALCDEKGTASFRGTCIARREYVGIYKIHSVRSGKCGSAPLKGALGGNSIVAQLLFSSPQLAASTVVL